MQTLPIALPIALPILLTACALDGVRGDGHARTELRALAPFRAVEVRGAIEAELELGEPARVEVSADRNLLARVRTELRGDTLIVESVGPLSPVTPLRVRVWAPELERLEVRGASEVALRGLREGTLELGVSGASTVRAAGVLTHLVARVSGASELEADALSVDALELDASGASSASVRARATAELEASGASSVELRGEATVTRRDASGASSIEVRGG